MTRRIIKIDEEKCNGCSLCVSACHEGAIGMSDGKAKLLRDDYCDGLGDCLPVCPTGAITFVERDATEQSSPMQTSPMQTHLNQWPVQIKLVPPNAPYFDNTHLLIAADCTAYAYGNFHNEYMKNKTTIIGCPKLDDADYSKKLTDILINNNVKSVTVARMEVPCCGGIESAAKTALKNCGKLIQWQTVTISTNGKILED